MRPLLLLCLMLAGNGCIFASPLPDCDAECAKHPDGPDYDACMSKCIKGEGEK